MNIQDFEPEMSISIEVHYQGEQRNFSTESATVHKNLLLLQPIYANGKLLGFSDNCTVDLSTTRDQTFYCWRNIKIKPVKIGGEIFHAAELIGEAEIVNRRNNFRVFFGDSMPITHFTHSGPKQEHFVVKDISETGFAFLSEELFEVGRTVRLSVPLPDRSTINVTGKIVRTQEVENSPKIIYGCQFSENNKKLANYLMKVQRDKAKGDKDK